MTQVIGTLTRDLTAKMRLHILNDLHLKHARMAPVEVRGDVLVLTGDIVDGGDPGPLLALTEKYRAAKLPILYVLGNHEFYGRRMHEVLIKMWRACRANGIEMLHNRAVIINGVRFFGSTLWTDYKLERASMQAKAMRDAKQFMADHTWISVKQKGQARTFTPHDALLAHEKAIRLLQARLSEPFDGPSVVLSHHGPSPKSVHPRWAAHPVNGAFNSNLEHLMSRFKMVLWAHGHVHDSFDYQVWLTRVIANPRGYPMRREPDSPFENKQFDDSLLIEV